MVVLGRFLVIDKARVVGCMLGISMESRVVDRPWYRVGRLLLGSQTSPHCGGPILALNPRNRRVWLAADEWFHWWC